MDDQKKKEEKNISVPHVLTREDQEMLENDSYESRFESYKDEQD